MITIPADSTSAPTPTAPWTETSLAAWAATTVALLYPTRGSLAAAKLRQVFRRAQ